MTGVFRLHQVRREVLYRRKVFACEEAAATEGAHITVIVIIIVVSTAYSSSKAYTISISRACEQHMGSPRQSDSSPPGKFLLNHCDDGLISGGGHYMLLTVTEILPAADSVP